MSHLGFHIRFRLEDDSVIAGTIEERRMLARAVLELGRPYNLYAFGYPDTHVHLAARIDRAGAGHLARMIESSLKQRLALKAGFVQYKPKPIEDNHHLYRTVRYVLQQVERHGVNTDPRREGSSLPDLLGMRLVGRYTVANLRRWLPRLARPDFLECMGLTDLAPADDQLELLLPAALAAGCRSDLTGRSRAVLDLRRAILEIVGDRLGTAAAAELLGINARAIQRLRARPVDDELVQAIRLQLGLARPFAV